MEAAHVTEKEALAELERLRAQRDAALKAAEKADGKVILAQLEASNAELQRLAKKMERRKAIEARLVAPLDKMKRQIVRKIKQLEAAKLN